MNRDTHPIEVELQQIKSEKDWLESQLKAWINTAQSLQEKCQQQLNQSSLLKSDKGKDIEISQAELYGFQKQLDFTELQLYQTQEELELSQFKLYQTKKQLRLTELQLYQTQEELEQLQMSQFGNNIEAKVTFLPGSNRNTSAQIQEQNRQTESKLANLPEAVLETYQDYMKLGNKLRKTGEIEEAVTYYLKAVQLNPKNFQAYIAIKSILQSHTCSAKILSNINKVCLDLIKEKNQSIYACFLLARSATEQGKIEKSMQYYKQGVYYKISKLKPKYVKKNWDSAQWQGPSYIVIGAPKCATTSLDKYLSQHPQILPAIVKELGYFSSKLSQQKIDYYFSHFPPTPEDRSFISGDADPNYLYIQYVPERIFQELPNIKLISMLRNPVDRTISNYHHAVRLGRETRSLETVINSELEVFKEIEEFNLQIFYEGLSHKCKFLSRSLYIVFLEKWLNIFSKEQMLILKTEDLKEKPAEFMDTVFSFLEVSKHSFVFEKKHNTGSYDPLSPELRNRLSEFFKPYNQKLEEYLGRKFDWE